MDTHIILELGQILAKISLPFPACMPAAQVHYSKGVSDEGHYTHMLARIGLPPLGTITGTLPAKVACMAKY